MQCKITFSFLQQSCKRSCVFSVPLTVHIRCNKSLHFNYVCIFLHSCFHGFETGPTERVKYHKYIWFQKMVMNLWSEKWNFGYIFRPFIPTAIISFSWLIAVSVLRRSWWYLHKLHKHVTCRLIRAFTWVCPCTFVCYLYIVCAFLVSRPIVKGDIFLQNIYVLKWYLIMDISY